MFVKTIPKTNTLLNTFGFILKDLIEKRLKKRKLN